MSIYHKSLYFEKFSQYQDLDLSINARLHEAEKTINYQDLHNHYDNDNKKLNITFD